MLTNEITDVRSGFHFDVFSFVCHSDRFSFQMPFHWWKNVHKQTNMPRLNGMVNWQIARWTSKNFSLVSLKYSSFLFSVTFQWTNAWSILEKVRLIETQRLDPYRKSPNKKRFFISPPSQRNAMPTESLCLSMFSKNCFSWNALLCKYLWKHLIPSTFENRSACCAWIKSDIMEIDFLYVKKKRLFENYEKKKKRKVSKCLFKVIRHSFEKWCGQYFVRDRRFFCPCHRLKTSVFFFKWKRKKRRLTSTHDGITHTTESILNLCHRCLNLKIKCSFEWWNQLSFFFELQDSLILEHFEVHESDILDLLTSLLCSIHSS